MKKTKIIAVVMYSAVVVAIMGFLCYQCYTLTNSNIELNNAYKDLETLYTNSEKELSSLRSDYNTICEENQALIASSHDKKTVELLEMMMAAADSMNFYHICTKNIDTLGHRFENDDNFFDHGWQEMTLGLSLKGKDALKEISSDVEKEIQSGKVYGIIAWIESNYHNYSSDIGYQLGTLKHHLLDTFTNLKKESNALYAYYISNNSNSKSAHHEAYYLALDSEIESSDKAEEIISNIITYCIETLYSETNEKF